MKHTLSGICLLATAGAVVFGTMHLPVPEQLTTQTKNMPAVRAAGGALNLVCTGNAESLIATGAQTVAGTGSSAENQQVTQSALGLALLSDRLHSDSGSRSGFDRSADTPSDSSANSTHAGENPQEPTASAGIIWRDALPTSTNTSSDSASNSTHSATDATDATTGTQSAGETILQKISDESVLLQKSNLAALSGTLSLTREEIQLDTVTAVNTHRATAGDLRGIAANPCTWATNASWFVGLQSGVGTANQLRLVNPSANPLVVELQAFNSLGPTQAGANANITIAPGQIKKISLDGILEANEQIALRLQSSTGLFGASIESTELSGLTPHGIGFIPAATSGEVLVIPGLYLPPAQSTTDNGGKPLVEINTDAQVQQQDDPQSLTADETEALLQAAQSESAASTLIEANFKASVRIVNPTADPRTVNVYPIREGEAPKLLAGGEKIQIAPGTVFDLSLDGLESGSYALQLIADGEISAAVRTNAAAGSDGTDYAWLSAQTPLTSGLAGFVPGQARLIASAFSDKVNDKISDQDDPSEAFGKLTWTAFDQSGAKLKSGTLMLSPQDGSDSAERGADPDAEDGVEDGTEDGVAENQTTTSSAKMMSSPWKAATASVELPEKTAFVAIEANTPVYAGVSISEVLETGRLLDWVPFTTGLSEVADITVDLQN